ncbi:MAG: HEAT repeat domain-containing protein, partial [Planctomycetota bacterium]
RQTETQQRHVTALAERLDAALRQLYAATPDAGRQDMIPELLRGTLPETRKTGLALAAKRVAASEPLADETAGLVRGLLDDDDPAVRTAAARLAADLKDEQAAELIMDRLDAETVAEVRSALIAALGAIGDARALDVLVKTVTAGGNGEAVQAALAVERLVTHAPPADERAAKVAEVLIDRYARSPTSQSDLRRALLRAMRALNHPAFAEVMGSALSDPEAPIRLEAMRGLARLGVTDAADAIARLTADSDRGVRQAAIATLAELGTPAHVEAVLGRTHPDVESDPVVRRRAWQTVPMLMNAADNEAVTRIIDHLADRPDAQPCRIRLMGMLIDRLAADKPRQVAVRMQLAEVLRTEGRPAEAADMLAEALPIAGGDVARDVWLAWVEAMLAADDLAVLTAMHDQADDALFAAAVERLVNRLAALRDAGRHEQMAALTEAARSRLGERLTEAQQTALRSIRDGGSTRPSEDAAARVDKLVAALASDDATRREEAEAALLAMEDRAVRPLLLRLRENLAAGQGDTDLQTRLAKILTTLAPDLTGFDDTADQAARLDLVDRWIAQLEG